jgi:hypothetical protein
MKPHKWAKEIKAWADGAEIEAKEKVFGEWTSIRDVQNYYNDAPNWNEKRLDFRIKPQPKEPQDSFKAMCEIPYKQWVLRFYQMPNDLWYSEGMDDAWMKKMVEASKPQPQYLYVYQADTNMFFSVTQNMSFKSYIGKIKLEAEND